MVKKNITLYILILFFISSCSTKTDFFTNRTYRYVVLKYNVIFYGLEAMKKYENSIEEEYTNDFFHILPLYPDHSENTDSLLTKAEEKARKGINKHSMLIDGNEKNKYIDRAYLLLGKSLYYQKEYHSAIETFNYAKSHLKGFTEWINCCIWLEKSNIAIAQYDSGEEFLNQLLKNRDLSNEQEKEIYKLLSESNIKKENFNKAETYLNKLISIADNKKERHRYIFILAQILKTNNQKKESNDILDNLIKDNPEDVYVVQSEILRASFNTPSISNSDRNMILKPLFKIIKEKKYEEFESVVFYKIADVYFKSKMIDSSLFFANKAGEISRKYKDRSLETGITYYLLQKCYFEKGDYVNAIKYCDESLSFLKNHSLADDKAVIKELIDLKRNLSTITRYINSYQEKDDIILLSKIPKNNLKEYLREKVIKESEDLKNSKQNEMFNNTTKNISSKITNDNLWYFYNDKLIEIGIRKFKSKWGNRKLVDNWRIVFEENTEIITNNELEEKKSEEDKGINEATIIEERVNYLISKIPSNDTELTNLINIRNYEYYSVAILYRDQFKRPDLCINQLLKLILLDPFEDLVLPSYYFLYKSYTDIEDIENAEKYKNIILNDFKDSRYALILKQSKSTDNNENSPKKLYSDIYNAFRLKDYNTIIQLSSEFERRFPNSDLSIKIDFLVAISYANIDIEKYIEKLDFILFNYPGSKESQEAEFLKRQALNFNKVNDSIPRNVSSIPQYMIILSDNEKYNKVLDELHFVFKEYSISFEKKEDIPFILISSFKNKFEANENINFFLRRTNGFFTKNDIFVISKLDFQRLVKFKSLSSILKK